MEEAMCPICMDTMFPVEDVTHSFCQPVAHFCHRDCWNAQTGGQKLHCMMCRQREVGEMELIMICEAFALDEGDIEVVEQLPPFARQLLRAWQLGQIDDLESHLESLYKPWR